MSTCTCKRCTTPRPRPAYESTPPTHRIHFGEDHSLPAWRDPDEPRKIIAKGGTRWSLDGQWAEGVLEELGPPPEPIGLWS